MLASARMSSHLGAAISVFYIIVINWPCHLVSARNTLWSGLIFVTITNTFLLINVDIAPLLTRASIALHIRACFNYVSAVKRL